MRVSTRNFSSSWCHGRASSRHKPAPLAGLQNGVRVPADVQPAAAPAAPGGRAACSSVDARHEAHSCGGAAARRALLARRARDRLARLRVASCAARGARGASRQARSARAPTPTSDHWDCVARRSPANVAVTAKYLDDLNETQREAVLCPLEPLMIGARGPRRPRRSGPRGPHVLASISGECRIGEDTDAHGAHCALCLRARCGARRGQARQAPPTARAGIPAANILAITFTRKAAGESHRRADCASPIARDTPRRRADELKRRVEASVGWDRTAGMVRAALRC